MHKDIVKDYHGKTTHITNKLTILRNNNMVTRFSN